MRPSISRPREGGSKGNQSPLVVVPKYHRVGQGFSKAEHLASMGHPGRRTDGSQSPASWVTDLLSLKKIIILCSYCRPKFNPRKHHYRRFYMPDVTSATDGYRHNGICDGCKQRTENCGGGTAFIHESSYNLVCIDPVDARRKARIRWRGSNLLDKLDNLN